MFAKSALMADALARQVLLRFSMVVRLMLACCGTCLKIRGIKGQQDRRKGSR